MWVGNCTARDPYLPAGYSLKGLPSGSLDDSNRYWGLTEGYHVGPFTISGVSFPAEKDIMIYRLEANSKTIMDTPAGFVIEGYNNVGISPNSATYDTKKFRRFESNRSGLARMYSNTKNEVRNIAQNNGAEFAKSTWPHLYFEQNFKRWYDFAMFDKLDLRFQTRMTQLSELPGWQGSFKDATFMTGIMVRQKGTMGVIFLTYTFYSDHVSNYQEQIGVEQWGQGLYRGPASDTGGVMRVGDPFRLIQIDARQVLTRALHKAGITDKTADDYLLASIGVGFESVGYHEYEFEVKDFSLIGSLKPEFDLDVFNIGDYRAYNPTHVGNLTTTATRLHWLKTGSRSGLRGSDNFDSRTYLQRYPDLIQAFGATNFIEAIRHFVNFGRSEGRSGR